MSSDFYTLKKKKVKNTQYFNNNIIKIRVVAIVEKICLVLLTI